jgi:hypothetical protein
MVEMTEGAQEAQTLPRPRVAGVFYLLTFVTGGIAAFSGRLVVDGDAGATAANILAHQSLFWLGLAAYIMVVACYVAVTALFYELFRPVSESLSLLAAFFSLVGCAIQATICVFLPAALAFFQGASYFSAFTREQQQAFGYLSLELFGQGFDICFVFFGFYCVLIGYLIFRSTFLPRVIGVLILFAGLGWLTFCVPPLAHSLDPYIRIPGVLGEASLTLWLLVAGVNVERWKELARGDRSRMTGAPV